jgi:hypothetical protein
MKNVMLDIETFGTQPGSVIRSIGAATFDLDGSVGATFYANIDDASALAAGLVIDPKTAEWWLQQPAAARRALLVNPIPFRDALRQFRDWYWSQNAPFVWAQGANFDPPLLEAAYRAVGEEPPWRFYNVRDTRTVYDLFSFDTRDLVRMRVHHNALDDTLHQIALVAAALRNGRVPTPKKMQVTELFE